MPKAVKKPVGKGRREALADQLMQDDATKNLRTVPRKKAGRASKASKKQPEEDGQEILCSKMTRKVFDTIAEQQREEEDGLEGMDSSGAKEAPEEIEEEVIVDEEGYLDMPCNEEEEAAMRQFLPKEEPTRNLADMIMGAIQDRTNQTAAAPNEALEATTHTQQRQLSPKVIQVYTDIGKWLKTYKSGKLPKPFLVIASLSNWEEVLCLTNPLQWSPNALREATKIFASQLNARMAQRFYNLVLLPAIRQDILDKKKLNFHYYEALKKAMFKPAAFMKGILIPLAAESCTLREAHIVSSILQKISVPVLHASAVLMKLADMTPWFGTTAMLMGMLINKKYSLPYSVVNKLCDHFYSFVEDDRELPLVWHRTLLVFLQRYRGELTPDQRDRMRHLVKLHSHHGIGQECKRELLAAVQQQQNPNAPGANATTGGMPARRSTFSAPPRASVRDVEMEE